MFYVPVSEQETVIQYSRNDPNVTVWTSDSTQMNRMDKLVETDGSLWKCIDIGYANVDGKRSIISKEYRGQKALLTIRAKRNQLTDEQKKNMAQNAKRFLKGKEKTPCCFS